MNTKYNIQKQLPYPTFKGESYYWKLSIWFLINFHTTKIMSAINRQSKSASNYKSLLIVVGVIAIAAGLLFAYLMFYTAPAEEMEMVKVVAITESGCIAETLDGYSVNIGECQAQPGEYTDALVDQKLKERAAAMNPTS